MLAKRNFFCLRRTLQAGAICWFEGGHSDSLDPNTVLQCLSLFTFARSLRVRACVRVRGLVRADACVFNVVLSIFVSSIFVCLGLCVCVSACLFLLFYLYLAAFLK